MYVNALIIDDNMITFELTDSWETLVSIYLNLPACIVTKQSHLSSFFVYFSSLHHKQPHKKQILFVIFVLMGSTAVFGVSFSLQVNVLPGCEVVCFSLTGCLLRKMSAVHLQHIHFEITLKTPHGNSRFPQPLGKQAPEQHSLYMLHLPVQCQGFTVCQTAVQGVI